MKKVRPPCKAPKCKKRVHRYDAQYCSALCARAAASGDNRAPFDIPKAPKVGEDIERDVLIGGLREQVGRYRKAYTEAIQATLSEQRLLDLFSTAIRAFPPLPATAFSKKLAAPPRGHERVLADNAEVPMLLLGDQQIGEEISLEETFGLNQYNFEIFQQRLEFLETRVLDILNNHQAANFKDLVVISLGDNISGRIHPELQKFGNQHVIDQVYLGAVATALFFYRLKRLGGFEKVRVVCVSGNHGRLDKDKDSKKYYKNFDYLFNSIVATLLKDIDGIDVIIPQCLFTVIEVAGNRILVSHGHEMPPSSLGIPLYSINRASASYQQMLSMTDDKGFSYWVMGHFHRPLELDNAMVNGTMAGISEYGIGKFKPIVPMQRLMAFHPRHGKSWEYPIRLDQAPAERVVYNFDATMTTPAAIELFSKRVEAA